MLRDRRSRPYEGSTPLFRAFNTGSVGRGSRTVRPVSAAL